MYSYWFITSLLYLFAYIWRGPPARADRRRGGPREGAERTLHVYTLCNSMCGIYIYIYIHIYIYIRTHIHILMHTYIPTYAYIYIYIYIYIHTYTYVHMPGASALSLHLSPPCASQALHTIAPVEVPKGALPILASQTEQTMHSRWNFPRLQFITPACITRPQAAHFSPCLS